MDTTVDTDDLAALDERSSGALTLHACGCGASTCRRHTTAGSSTQD